MTAQTSRAVIAQVLADSELDWTSTDPDTFSVTLPGTAKLRTECALLVGPHAVQIAAFVARHPESDPDRVHRWLLERNLSLLLVAFSLDRTGDIHLTGRLPHAAVNADSLDAVLGEVARVADDSFNTILELGYADAIRREWAWRLARGESTANLAAFEHLRPQ